MSHEDLVEAIESAYDVVLPARYRKFVLGGEYEKYRKIQFKGYIQGPYELNFVHPDLADVAELGISLGIANMDDVPWEDDFASYVPLAALVHPKGTEPKMFLVLDVESPGNPVLLFSHDGWRLFRLAESFTAFLSRLPVIHTDIVESFCPAGESGGDEDEDGESSEDEDDDD